MALAHYNKTRWVLHPMKQDHYQNELNREMFIVIRAETGFAPIDLYGALEIK